MKQKATVIKTYGKTAVVSVERSSMCDGCHKNCGGGCSMYKIFGGDKHFEAVVNNPEKAEVGDLVYVETAERKVILGAFFVFMLPLIITFAAYAVTSLLANGIVCTLIPCIVFVLYYAVLVVSEKCRQKKAPQLSITEIIK